MPLFLVCIATDCRHVILPGDIAKLVPRTHLMTETEWRNLGVQQSMGWVHYMVHDPGSFVIIQWKFETYWIAIYYFSHWCLTASQPWGAVSLPSTV